MLRTEDERRPFWALAVVALVAICGMGVGKLMVALERGRTNVGFLIGLTAIGGVLAIGLLKPPQATRAGAEYLKWLREAHGRARPGVE